MREVSCLILDIIFEYALNKFDDPKDRLAAGAARFLLVINQFVIAETRVEACLPSFPFKAANKVYKVLSTLPDKAEELALEWLNSMCTRIRDVDPPGAKVTIISDGITYNGVSNTNSIVSLSNVVVFHIVRLIVHIGSRHLGLRRGSTQNSYPEGVQLYWLLQNERLARFSSTRKAK